MGAAHRRLFSSSAWTPSCDRCQLVEAREQRKSSSQLGPVVINACSQVPLYRRISHLLKGFFNPIHPRLIQSRSPTTSLPLAEDPDIALNQPACRRNYLPSHSLLHLDPDLSSTLQTAPTASAGSGSCKWSA